MTLTFILRKSIFLYKRGNDINNGTLQLVTKRNFFSHEIAKKDLSLHPALECLLVAQGRPSAAIVCPLRAKVFIETILLTD